MKLAVCILARNEAAAIGPFLTAFARQSIFRSAPDSVTIFVVPNGCSDNTAGVAAEAGAALFAPIGVAFEVIDLAEPGKSRAWNRFVHGGVLDRFDCVAFADADIEFISENAISDGVGALAADPAIRVYAGNPLKDISASEKKSTLDRLSLASSRLTAYTGVISGQFYIARSSCLATIWLPDETPGEDGFLNAMVDTDGFTRQPVAGAIVQPSVPTHYYEAHSPSQFLSHERRMIVGTMINRWIFEHLWSLKLTEPAGPLIARWNAENPAWVDDLVAARVKGRNWVIPTEIVTRRMQDGGRAGIVGKLIGVAAALLTIPSAFLANRALKRRGAASLW